MPDFELPPEVSTSTLMLERVKVAARSHLSPQMAHDLDIRMYEDVVSRQMNSMILELRTHVYAAHVADVKTTVPFECEDSLEIPAARSLVLPQAVATFAATAVGLYEGSVFMLLVASLFALVSVYAFVRNPDYTVPWRKTGTVDVTVKVQDTFPDNSEVYPKSLGKYVRMTMLDKIDVRYLDDNR